MQGGLQKVIDEYCVNVNRKITVEHAERNELANKIITKKARKERNEWMTEEILDMMKKKQ